MEKSYKNLTKLGFEITHQRGDHIYLSDGTHKITVSKHNPVKKGTLQSIIKQAGLEKSDFLDL